MVGRPSYTKGNEGCRLVSYDDDTGMPLAAGDTPEGTCTVGYGDTGPDVVPGLIITQADAEARFERKYAVACADAQSLLGATAWAEIGEDRQVALIDMAYELGKSRLSLFSKMLDALRVKAWQLAHDEVLNSAEHPGQPSRYAKQAPIRARKNALAFAGEPLPP